MQQTPSDRQRTQMCEDSQRRNQASQNLFLLSVFKVRILVAFSRAWTLFIYSWTTHAAEGTSTAQDVAKAIGGVHCSTLYRWLRLDLIAEPAFVQVGRDANSKAAPRQQFLRALHQNRAAMF